MTYAAAEHEQVKGKMIFPVGEKKFVFTNGEMHLLSDVILNQNLSSNDRAKAVVELLTGETCSIIGCN